MEVIRNAGPCVNTDPTPLNRQQVCTADDLTADCSLPQTAGLARGEAMARHRNGGIRKVCDCPRRNWPKCSHSWYFNYKPRGGRAWRFSLDSESATGQHIAGKTEAEALATNIRAAINAGTFERLADRRVREAREAAERKAREAEAQRLREMLPEGLTFDDFRKKFIDNKAKASGKKTWTNDESALKQIGAFTLSDGVRLGAKALAAITEDDLESFHAHLRMIGRAASTRNQYVQVIKSSFKWATKKGYLTRNPITDDSILKRTKVAQRSRRLAPDVFDDRGKLKRPGEERRLLAATAKNAGLQRLIIAAIETACRRGELLALTFADVDLPGRALRIRAETAKDAETRVLPISARLAAVLEMAKIDPAGNEYEPSDFVFGECGRQVTDIKKAWETAVLKAAGYTPTWGPNNTLTPESRAHLDAVDLHFHDLRHEGASRLLEAGWPLHHVSEMLGHSNVGQTSTYLNAGKHGLSDSMRRFDPARCNSVAKPIAIEHPTNSNGVRHEDEQVTVN
jgi:integrase